MQNNQFKQYLPHLAAVALFIIFSFAYLRPVLEGKQIIAHDTQSWMCMAKETIDFNENNDDVTLWTNSMFGGMPNYQISMDQPYNLIKYVEKVILSFPQTVYNLILYLIGFYILLLTFRVNPWLAIVGAIAFTFASYNFIIIAAGHNSKAITIAYMAPLIGSVFSAFRYNKIGGGILTAFFLSLAVRANHIQILYYTLIILLIFGVVELIYSIKEKTLPSFLKSTGMVLAGVVIALGMNATALITTYEYGKYTMRGDSNGLTTDVQNVQNGLNKEYITQWSYGVDESMTLLIPDFKGGASGGVLSEDSETAQTIKDKFKVPNIKKTMEEYQLPLYWGTQPFTSGPVYIGAIVIFLFVLGFWTVDKRILWWLIPTIILTLMLSWGKNFMWLTDIFVDYVPLYKKFRTVSMTLVATGFGITLIAVLALKEIFTTTDKGRLIKPILISAGITAGIALIFALIPSLAGSFTSEADAQFTGEMAFLKDTLPTDRASMLRADAFRSVLFILSAAALLWLYIKNLLKTNVTIVLIGILLMLDLVPVAYRYLNDNNFERKRNIKNIVQPTAADNLILQDKSEFRVLDATVNIFNDATPSYFHKNIGGYHAAKLRRYQELINSHIEPEIGQLFGAFNRAKTFDEIQPVLDSLGVLNMLNMKYVIYNKEAAPLVNSSANGNAWFVQKINIAANADEEMKLTGSIDTRREVVIDKQYAEQISVKPVNDTTATIVLKSYKPNELVYNFNAKTDQMAVFSEIYYDKGWNAYIKGENAPYVRANYLLRAMPLKAGNYEVVFKFEPKAYKTGNIIAIASSIAFILIIALYFFRRKKS